MEHQRSEYFVIFYSSSFLNMKKLMFKFFQEGMNAITIQKVLPAIINQLFGAFRKRGTRNSLNLLISSCNSGSRPLWAIWIFITVFILFQFWEPKPRSGAKFCLLSGWICCFSKFIGELKQLALLFLMFDSQNWSRSVAGFALQVLRVGVKCRLCKPTNRCHHHFQPNYDRPKSIIMYS